MRLRGGLRSGGGRLFRGRRRRRSLALLDPELFGHGVRQPRDTALRVEHPAGPLGVAARLAQAQAEAVAVPLDAHDPGGDDVALGDHLARVVDAAIGQLGHVDEAFDRPFQPRKRAERDQLGHGAGHDLPDLEAGHDLIPLFGRGAPDREADLLRLFVDLGDEHADLLADGEHLLRVDVALPGELGEVREAVGPAQIDEHAEGPDAGDPTGADFVLVQLVEQAIFLLGAPFLHGGALGEDHAVATAVDLDHLEAQRAALVFAQLGDGLLAVAGDADDLAERNEGVDALNVDQQAALVAAADPPVEDFALVVATLQLVPALLAAGAVDRELERAALGLGIGHVDVDEVAGGEPLAVGLVKRAHLFGMHDAFGLGADINDQHGARPVDDDALDDVATLRIERLAAFFGEQRFHGVGRERLGRRRLGRGRFGERRCNSDGRGGVGGRLDGGRFGGFCRQTRSGAQPWAAPAPFP